VKAVLMQQMQQLGVAMDEYRHNDAHAPRHLTRAVIRPQS
jgi:hypothetical protein